MSRLECRIISLEEARAYRVGKRDAERLAMTSEFFRRIVTAQRPTPEQAAEGDRAAAALIEYLNNGGGGDEAA